MGVEEAPHLLARKDVRAELDLGKRAFAQRAPDFILANVAQLLLAVRQLARVMAHLSLAAAAARLRAALVRYCYYAALCCCPLLLPQRTAHELTLRGILSSSFKEKRNSKKKRGKKREELDHTHASSLIVFLVVVAIAEARVPLGIVTQSIRFGRNAAERLASAVVVVAPALDAGHRRRVGALKLCVRFGRLALILSAVAAAADVKVGPEFVAHLAAAIGAEGRAIKVSERNSSKTRELIKDSGATRTWHRGQIAALA